MIGEQHLFGPGDAVALTVLTLIGLWCVLGDRYRHARRVVTSGVEVAAVGGPAANGNEVTCPADKDFADGSQPAVGGDHIVERSVADRFLNAFDRPDVTVEVLDMGNLVEFVSPGMQDRYVVASFFEATNNMRPGWTGSTDDKGAVHTGQLTRQSLPVPNPTNRAKGLSPPVNRPEHAEWFLMLIL